MRRSTATSAPLCSPARTMLTYKSVKICGCRAIASDSDRPSVTSCFNSRLTPAGMPFVSRCVMLFSATVNGMPEFSRLASCVVKVASSCNFGFRFCASCACKLGGKNAVRFTPLSFLTPVTAPALASATAMGKSPER